MPNAGDHVAYFWFPLRERLPLEKGPHQPELNEEMWSSGGLRPSQPDLPQPTLDISLFLRDAHTAQDDGLRATKGVALRRWELLLGRTWRARFLRWAGEIWWRIMMRGVVRQSKTPITVVEAAVTLPEGISSSSDDFEAHLTSALDSALSLTRELVLTASVESHEPRLLPALELLPPVVPWLLAVLADDRGLRLDKAQIGMLSNAAHRAWDTEVVAESPDGELPPLFGFPNVYASYQALRNDAEMALIHHGQYRAAVVLAAAAAESFLTVLMESLLLEDGTGVEKAREVLESRNGMRVRAERVLGPRLGGQWDGREGSPVGEWVRKIVKPRNTVLHAGTHVTRHEAQEACAELHSFRRWVGGRVFSKRRKFPKTALAMSLGVMMSPDGTQDDQWGWVTKRLSEADEDFAGFIEALPGWASDI